MVVCVLTFLCFNPRSGRYPYLDSGTQHCALGRCQSSSIWSGSWLGPSAARAGVLDFQTRDAVERIIASHAQTGPPRWPPYSDSGAAGGE